eukprot:COSAG02_NODE_4_length_69935_cov_46.806590_24_plen_80_part_00
MMVASGVALLLGCLAVGHVAAQPECSLNGEKKGGVRTQGILILRADLACAHRISATAAAGLPACIPTRWLARWLAELVH